MTADELEQVRAGLRARTKTLAETNGALSTRPTEVVPEVPVLPFRRWTTAELLSAKRSFRWTARGLLVRPTHGMFGGLRKTLKSTVGDFIDVGIAAGLPVFGRFRVDEAGPVCAYVGEGGRLPYTRRLERVASAIGVGSLRDIPLYVSFDVAPIGSARFEESLRRDLGEVGPLLVHIDPLYAYHPALVNASNLFQEGAMLTALSERCVSSGASCLVTSHFNKTGSGAGLDRITQAGGQEWSDSWLLLSHRRDPDVTNGLFHLTLEVGSRQWGGSTWELDMDLGRFDEDLGDYDAAITWDLRRAGSATSRQQGRLAEIVSAQPWALSREALAKALGGNLTAARHAIDEALRRGEIAAIEAQSTRKNGRPYRVTVFGPPTNVRPPGTDMDEHCEAPPFPLVEGASISVQGSDDD